VNDLSSDSSEHRADRDAASRPTSGAARAGGAGVADGLYWNFLLIRAEIRPALNEQRARLEARRRRQSDQGRVRSPQSRGCC